MTSHSFLRYLQPEILTNIFGAFTNAHPVAAVQTDTKYDMIQNIIKAFVIIPSALNMYTNIQGVGYIDNTKKIA